MRELVFFFLHFAFLPASFTQGIIFVCRIDCEAVHILVIDCHEVIVSLLKWKFRLETNKWVIYSQVIHLLLIGRLYRLGWQTWIWFFDRHIHHRWRCPDLYMTRLIVLKIQRLRLTICLLIDSPIFILQKRILIYFINLLLVIFSIKLILIVDLMFIFVITFYSSFTYYLLYYC